MKASSKHIISGGFFTIIALPFICMLALLVAQYVLKATREDRLQHTTAITVIVPAKKLVWEEEGKELWVGEKMFDVRSYQIIDGQYYLTGIFDEKETKVAGSFLHAFASKKPVQLLYFFVLLQSAAVVLYFSVLLVQDIIRLKHSSNYRQASLSIYQSVPVPPPWAANTLA